MHSSTIIYFLGAIAIMPLALLTNAGPSLPPALATRQYQSWCCIPGCLTCEINDCLNQPCYGVYSSCCAEGRREVGEDGKLQIFNINGEKMEFAE
ncbi:hypothetical protein F4813DRAFT_388070 [Daldinia decipiens]|uniref:uncharacterized protein n=1 Tax=Daldinia decipiens TaxID=326647 RepID=UPI0020C2B552|nr:uncharacterized protein F4813DRAFT_388070 [Daldinia decipiens]KAI1659362.1 hypothetical protein F4813DRAFT_388070 [Daldinia decipiens]